MFEKISEMAEQIATNASRRQFLGRLGRGATALAAVAGGVLAIPTIAQGGRAVIACGPTSQIACRGKLPGAGCNIGSSVGICDWPPNCTCRTCPRGSFWQSCSNGKKICCRRGYYCYVRDGQPTCRRGA